MCVGRRGHAEGCDELEMFRRIHQVVLAPDHVGDPHGEVIDHIHEVKHEGAIGPPDDHIGSV